MNRVALYLRVSTLDQNSDSQRRELESYARRHSWNVAGVYEDHASGIDPSRPELARLIAECRAGRVEIVLCWKLDRFGRSLLDCLHNLEILEAEMVRFVATSQGIDTDRKNPASKLLLHIMAAFAECEREMIRERCASGVRRYQEDFEAGRVGQSVHSKSGKDLPPHRPRRVVDRDKIIALRSQGLTVAAIAHQADVSPATVCRRLRQAVFQKVGPELREGAAEK